VTVKYAIKLSLICIALAQLAFAEVNTEQQNRLIQYLTDIGVANTIELQTEALREDYAGIYAQLPPCFWEHDRVISLFESYKSSILESYVVVMEQEFTPEEIEFLIRFYQTADGRRAVQLGKRMTPAFVAAGSKINQDFSESLGRLISEIVKKAQENALEEIEQST
jgi:hypothetical protein